MSLLLLDIAEKLRMQITGSSKLQYEWTILTYLLSSYFGKVMHPVKKSGFTNGLSSVLEMQALVYYRYCSVFNVKNVAKLR